jgi:hypothetical protein
MSLTGIASVGLGLLGLFETPTTVNLGGISFDGMSSPEGMPFGGSQMMQVHKLPGGGRVVDVFGRDDRDIEWSGMWSGPNAVGNARAIDAIRIAGKQVSLTWDDFSLNVVVREFHPEYTRGGGIVRYHIAVVVASLPPPSAPSLLAGVKADLAAVAGFVGQVQTVVSDVSAITTALGSGGSLPKTSPLYVPTVQGVQLARKDAADAQSQADVQLAAVKASPAAGTFGAAAAARALPAQQQSAAAAVAGGYLGRAANNLGNA